MRDFNRLDTTAFRGFYYAAETLNFTAASKKAAMTQSGVSQHISKLELQLGVPLFLRIGRRVVLTDAGKKLRKYIEQYLDQLEVFAESVTTAQSAVRGRVSYAMPASCLMTPHFPMLLEERKKRFPDLELNVSLCPSQDVIDKLLAGQIDLGFVAMKVPHADIRYIPFCPEEYVLVAGKQNAFENLSCKTLLDGKYISHPGVDTLFDYLVQHHFPRDKNLHWSDLKIIGKTNSLQGAIHMVESGMGMTAIPRHCVFEQIAKKRIFEFKGDSKKPLQNMIYIVTLGTGEPPRHVQAVIDVFMEMKGS